MPALTEDDGFVSNAFGRVRELSRNRALEISSGPASPELGCRFRTIETAAFDQLAGLPGGEFDFVLAARSFSESSHVSSVFLCLRESARLLRDGGILGARLNDRIDSPTRISSGELVELARDLDFQILAIEGAASESMSMIWRKRSPGWRLELEGQAALASAKIHRAANAWDDSPVVPSRGRYAALAIWVEGLPSDVDLLDLEVLIGGARSTATSIADPDPHQRQEIHATLPYLEQTGLVPLELRWFGERLTQEPAYIRVIPPGPSVPRIARAALESSGIIVSIEELARPDELTACIAGRALWASHSVCTDPVAQRYELQFRLPVDLPPGVHQLELKAGRRDLPSVAIEIA